MPQPFSDLDKEKLSLLRIPELKKGGVQGPRGEQGERGGQGIQGERGEQGVQGGRGADSYNGVVQNVNSVVVSATLTPIIQSLDLIIIGGGLVSDGVFTTGIVPGGVYEVRMFMQYILNTTVASPTMSLSLDGARLFNMQYTRSTSSLNHLPFYFSTLVTFQDDAVHTLTPEASIPVGYQVTFKRLHLSIFRVI